MPNYFFVTFFLTVPLHHCLLQMMILGRVVPLLFRQLPASVTPIIQVCKYESLHIKAMSAWPILSTLYEASLRLRLGRSFTSAPYWRRQQLPMEGFVRLSIPLDSQIYVNSFQLCCHRWDAPWSPGTELDRRFPMQSRPSSRCRLSMILPRFLHQAMGARIDFEEMFFSEVLLAS